MADLRKVTFVPHDSEPYDGWINFDRVKYIEDQGDDYRGRVAIVILAGDDYEPIIKVSKSWTSPKDK